MLNIGIAVDVFYPDADSINCGCYFAQLSKAKLTGILLENLDYAFKPVIKNLNNEPYVETVLTTDIPSNEDKRKAAEMVIVLFKETCKNKTVAYNIHADCGMPAEELINESRFTDVIIADATMSFSKKISGESSRFVKDILAESECPVIISCADFKTIDEIIFAYDGSASAMFAIKQFSYLFPALKEKKLQLFEVNKPDGFTLKYQHKIKEWMHNHYASVEVKVREGVASDELFTYLLTKQNSLVVMGAYGRGWLSRLFHKSSADPILETLNIPAFIAHR
jgi:hypothetical protein